MSNTVQIGAVIAESLFKLALNYTLCQGVPNIAPGYVDKDIYVDDLGIEGAKGSKIMSLGLGANGGFYKEEIRYYPLGIDDASEVCIADVNVDGFNDLVARGSSDFSFALADGKGKFGPVADLLSASTVVEGDFNGDGILDLAHASANEVSVQFADGVGGFGPVNSFPTPNGVRSMAAVDFNGDGKLDIVVADKDNLDKFSVLVNQGFSADSVNKASETVGIGVSSNTLVAAVAIVSLIAVAAIAYYLYTKSKQQKSVSSEESQFTTSSPGLTSSRPALYSRLRASTEDLRPYASSFCPV